MSSLLVAVVLTKENLHFIGEDPKVLRKAMACLCHTEGSCALSSEEGTDSWETQ